MNNEQSHIIRSWTVVTYPQDFSNNGGDLGPQTILRLEKLVETYNLGKYKISAIVLACGLGPNKYEYPNQSESFAVMMKRWLVNEGSIDPSIIHCSQNDRVWNCIEVTLEMTDMINRSHLSRNILVVSTGFHIYPRMWITWKILCSMNDSWKSAYIPAWNGKYSIIHESAGTVKYLVLALWYRLTKKF